LAGLSRIAEGQNALEEAISIARRQQAKSYELRAATSLARLWGEQGGRTEASPVPHPHWCDDPAGGRKPILAKAETVATLPTFRDAYARRRCLVPVAGFFEWHE
jgi:putative SOS response-associated peptidase YedK